MNDTARYLAACVSSNKTIVLTGAMVPRSIENSDADFNIGFALAAVKLLPPGIYIAMHGKALPYTEYIKDRTTGRFIQRGPQA
jgi:L-asparaginase